VPFTRGRPNLVIAHTHKGSGVSFMRDAVEWHHKIPNASQLEAARAELGSDQ
jgi:transketolase